MVAFSDPRRSQVLSVTAQQQPAKYSPAAMTQTLEMMTSQLRLQHPVEPVVNDYAILLQIPFCSRYSVSSI